MNRWLFRFAAAVLAVSGLGEAVRAQTVQPCADPNNCIEVKVSPASVSATPNEKVTVGISFKQGPTTGQPGGQDKSAALALTLDLGSPDSHVLALDDCTIGADGLPLSIRPAAGMGDFKVVVENASGCPSNGRTHCLCPDGGSGITPDGFINLVVYGPNPLPTPGPNPIEIPILPTQELVQIDLRVAAGATGTLPLHIYNQVQDAQKPQFKAMLSVGDKVAVDQTCVPVTGQPPCSGAGAISQVATADGQIVVAAAAVCVGACNDPTTVSVDNIITLVNISLGSADPSACPNGLPSGDSVTIDTIITAVNNSLTGCPVG